MKQNNTGVSSNMKKEYDFSNSVKNPYSKKIKKSITIRLDVDTIDYFKKLAQESGMSYQTLINSYLNDCVVNKVKPELVWH